MESAPQTLTNRGELTQEYLLFSLLTPLVQGLIEGKSSGSTAKGIRTAELYQIELPVPDIDQQLKFSTLYRKARAQAKKHHELNTTSLLLFNSLSQKAFAGELYKGE